MGHKLIETYERETGYQIFIKEEGIVFPDGNWNKYPGYTVLIKDGNEYRMGIAYLIGEAWYEL